MVKLTFSAEKPQLFEQPGSTCHPIVQPTRLALEAEVIDYPLTIVNKLDDELRSLKLHLAESTEINL